MTRARWLALCVFCSGALLASQAHAVQVLVTFENLAPQGGVALSPFTLAAHDGSFDAFDTGSAASTGIENVAEAGNGADLKTEAMTAYPSVVTDTAIATQGGFGPGIFLPGASGSVVLTLDPAMHRYLTYGAMVVPSNDAFLGNDSPTAVELFDAAGNFVAADFTLSGSDIWDAGTEVNGLFGAAYVVGQNGGDGTDEMGVVNPADLASLFGVYNGEGVPSGGTFTAVPTAGSPIASVSFARVPEPSTFAIFGLGGLTMLFIHRRRRSSVC